MIENDKDSGLECVRVLSQSDEILVRRGMADVLTRLFRRITHDAIPLLESMLEDEDESVLAAASATVGDLRFLDKDMWADKIRELCDHESKVVRRNLVHTLRDYMEEFDSDERGILPMLWNDGDEVVLTRLREFLIRMEEVDNERFSSTIKQLADSDLESLWALMEIKDEERTSAWKAWLYDGGIIPEQKPRTEIHVSDMTEGELPELDDALNMLDDMGFLD